MRVKFLSLDSLKLFKVILIIFGIFIVFMFFYFPNYAKIRELQRTNQQVITRINKLKQEIKDLEEKTKIVKKDDSFLEKLAREDLGVAKKDEIIVDIEE